MNRYFIINTSTAEFIGRAGESGTAVYEVFDEIEERFVLFHLSMNSRLRGKFINAKHHGYSEVLVVHGCAVGICSERYFAKFRGMHYWGNMHIVTPQKTQEFKQQYPECFV